MLEKWSLGFWEEGAGGDGWDDTVGEGVGGVWVGVWGGGGGGGRGRRRI